MKRIKNVYVHDRFFLLLGIAVFIFTLGFVYPFFFMMGKIYLVLLIALFVVDFFLLQTGIRIAVSRKVAPQLSLGDENKVELLFQYTGPSGYQASIIETAPYQLQLRDLKFLQSCDTGSYSHTYNIIPTERGKYDFGNVMVYLSSPLRILERRFTFETGQMVAVYPSVLQMKRLELKTFKRTATDQGVKKIRRLGHNNEFEQIRNYVEGDDYRAINWKASSRRHELMINQYQDEKAQRVYSIIDKSRNMRNPFEGLTLLDHTINSTLALSNIIIKKGDRAGLITFSDKMGVHIKAARSITQLKRINEALYQQKTNFLEADFELLYQNIRREIKGRSILIFYTNFESEATLKRVIPVLRMIAKKHLLIIVLFENTEVIQAMQEEVNDLKGIYYKTITEKFAMEKKQIVYELRKYGIQSVLTSPQNLTIDTLNKYLEIKSKGMG